MSTKISCIKKSKIIYDKISNNDESMKDWLGRVSTAKLNDIRFTTVLPYIEGSLLDIGCGKNELVREYYGSGVGVDVDSRGIKDVVVVKDTSKLSFADGSFDTVSILAALNHIPNREDVLTEANRVLKMNGKIIITMIPPRFSRFWHFIRRPWADEIERDFEHGQVYGLNYKQVQDLLGRTGFELVLHKKFMFLINSLFVGKKVVNLN